jgi:hypothetical protein
MVGEIVGGVIATGELLRVRALERIEEERKRQEEQRRADELRQLWEKERSRRDALEKQAEVWDKVDRLRAFIASCEARLANRNQLGSDSPGRRWIEWARRHADEVDPLNGEYLANAIHALPQDPVRVLM